MPNNKPITIQIASVIFRFYSLLSIEYKVEEGMLRRGCPIDEELDELRIGSLQ